MSHFHAVIWIDHKEAHVFHFNEEAADKLVLRAKHAARHIHHKANEVGSGHAGEDAEFLHAVAAAVSDAGEILITGPAGTKTALMKHLAKHDPHVFQRVAGVESSDHPTDGQLLAHARTYFNAADRRTPQKV